MIPDFNFVDYVVTFFGFLLCLKRVAQMERYHELRVIILTSIFGVIVVLFLLQLGSMFDESQYDCTYPQYCQTEM
jgi:ABC-type polysaccharide transport system permease subunit